MKYLSLILTLAAVFAPVATFAAMPNFVGTGYKVASNCTVPPDHGIWEDVSGVTVLTGCITHEALLQARALSDARQSGVQIKPGETVKLTSGMTDTCPVWIRYGCVASADEIVR